MVLVNMFVLKNVLLIRVKKIRKVQMYFNQSSSAISMPVGLRSDFKKVQNAFGFLSLAASDNMLHRFPRYFDFLDLITF